MAMPKDRIERIKIHLRLVVVALLFIAVVAILSTIYDLIANATFTGRYLFHANLFFGVVLIIAGCVLMFIPSAMLPKGDKLFDKTTFVERSFNVRQRRQSAAMKILIIGILVVVLTGLMQILLSVILT